MSKLTIFVYRFFKRRKGIFWIVFLATTLLFGCFASRITFEEDISTLLPSVEQGGAEKLVFSNLQVKDKVFLLFAPRSEETYPDDLAAVSDAFVEALFARDSAVGAIDHVLWRMDESWVENAVGFLYENVPLFLDGADYAKLDSLLQPAVIEAQMGENYTLVTSAAGSLYRDMVTHDPVALRKLFLAHAGSVSGGLGGSYAFYEGHLFTADTTVAVAFLSPNFRAFDSKQGTRLVDLIEETIAVFEIEHPDVEILYHGAPVQSVYNSKRIKLDLLLTISISLILILVILIGCFRNKSTLLHLVVPLIYGVFFALAVLYWMKGAMSLMAMGLGAIVMGVALSYCIHILTHFKYVNDPEKVLADETKPVVLGALTTIGAFMGLMFTGSELLRDFGLFASLGLVGTTAFCLFFLPQFLNPKNNRKSERAFAVLEKINSYPIERHKWLVVLILVVSAVCWAVSGRVKFDADLQNIGYHEEKVVRSRELLASKTTGNLATVYFAAVGDNLDSALVRSARLSRELDRFVATGQIEGYAAPAALFVPTDEQQARVERWNAYWTPQKKAAVLREVNRAGARHKFNERTFAPFAALLDADYEPVSLYEAGAIPPEILDNIIEYSDGAYLVFTPVRMDRANLRGVGDAIVSADPDLVVVDQFYYTADMVRMVHDDFSVTLAVSSLFVLLALLLFYRSAVLAFIAFLPMGLSWYIVLGCMVFFGLEFNLINIVISTFIFGIGVDYSIFIMDGLLEKYRRGEQLLVYHKTAILFSAIILTIVTLSLLFAVHPAIASIGVSTLIGMTATILIAYTLGPFLFELLVSRRAAKGRPPVALATLFRCSRKRTPVQTLRDNYLYKGDGVECTLRRELRASGNYAALTAVLPDTGSVLDLGCGYGFAAYWVALNRPGLSVTACDSDPDKLALAANGDAKTDRMHFAAAAAPGSRYDVVVIQQELDDAAAVAAWLPGAAAVVVRRDLLPALAPQLEASGFVSGPSDGLFSAYERK